MGNVDSKPQQEGELICLLDFTIRHEKLKNLQFPCNKQVQFTYLANAWTHIFGLRVSADVSTVHPDPHTWEVMKFMSQIP